MHDNIIKAIKHYESFCARPEDVETLNALFLYMRDSINKTQLKERSKNCKFTEITCLIKFAVAYKDLREKTSVAAFYIK